MLMYVLCLVAKISGYLCFIITRQEAIALPSIGFTSWRVSMVFTHSAITPPEVNRFG